MDKPGFKKGEMFIKIEAEHVNRKGHCIHPLQPKNGFTCERCGYYFTWCHKCQLWNAPICRAEVWTKIVICEMHDKGLPFRAARRCSATKIVCWDWRISCETKFDFTCFHRNKNGYNFIAISSPIGKLQLRTHMQRLSWLYDSFTSIPFSSYFFLQTYGSSFQRILF